MRDWKLRDWETRDQVTGVENAGLENVGPTKYGKSNRGSYIINDNRIKMYPRRFDDNRYTRMQFLRFRHFPKGLFRNNPSNFY